MSAVVIIADPATVPFENSDERISARIVQTSHRLPLLPLRQW